MEHLRVWNFSKSDSIPNLENAEVARFSTCMRTLFFGTKEIPELGSAHLIDKQAYQYLIQVLCGLESPVFGETEVFGQFKNQMEVFPKDMNSFVKTILTDVKSIRHKHLTGLGGSSYGSLSREFLGKSKLTVILGAGHLAQEVYPWLAKSGQKIIIAVRSLRPFGQTLNAQTEVQLVSDLSNINCDLVIAAPMSNQEINSWISINKIQVQKCLDFRAAPQSAGARFGKKSLDLPQIFETIQRNREDHSEVRNLAIADIGSLIDQRINQASLRPFGWEDLCV